MTPVYAAEKKTRLFLLQQATRYGPIFKTTVFNELCICVLGLELGRRLLRDHANDLTALAVDLKSFFPNGFLREMGGDDHRMYRQALMQAIQPEDFAAKANSMEVGAAASLAESASQENSSATDPKRFIAILHRITSGMLIKLFYRLAPSSSAFESVLHSYEKLSPEGFAWHPGEAQKMAFVEIRSHLLELCSTPHKMPIGFAQSILGRLHSELKLDETMIGNLIYIVETGRHDTASLFRWLARFAANHPEMVEQIHAENSDGAISEAAFTVAFVLETLRLEQSERLMRRVKRDFIFDDHLIPQSAFVRICVWEAHKSEAAFASPFHFDPTRFLKTMPGLDRFSPFGLDQHQCPFGDITIKMGIIFLRQLALGYTLKTIDDGAATRGPFHWEPAAKFTVQLTHRTP